MKTISKRLKQSLIVGVAALSFYSCKKDDTNNNSSDVMTKTGIMLTGAQERPTPNNSQGMGMLDVTYTKSTKVLQYKLSWSNLTDSVVGMHIHGPASKDSAAPVLYGISGFPTGKNESITGSATLNDTTASYLTSGRLYLNIHTRAFPGGEVRGQIEF